MLINEEALKNTKLQFQSVGLLIKWRDLILYFAVFRLITHWLKILSEKLFISLPVSLARRIAERCELLSSH